MAYSCLSALDYSATPITNTATGNRSKSVMVNIMLNKIVAPGEMYYDISRRLLTSLFYGVAETPQY